MPPEHETRPVAGIDLSLSSTGVAVWHGGKWNFDNPKTRGARGDSWTARARRVRFIAARVASRIPRRALVVVEGPSYRSVSVSVWERAALYYQVLQAVADRECHLGVVPPAVLKQWATGVGASCKAPVMDVARQFTGAAIPNDDVGDATILALIGLHKLGVIAPPGAWRGNTLRHVRWEATA